MSRQRRTPASPIGFAAEVIGTAILVFTVFGAAVDGRRPAGFAGIIIGFIVYGIIILVGPITGAALNPARQIGPDILGQASSAPRRNRSSSSSASTSSARSSVASSAPSSTSSSATPDRHVPGAAVAEPAHADA